MHETKNPTVHNNGQLKGIGKSLTKKSSNDNSLNAPTILVAHFFALVFLCTFLCPCISVNPTNTSRNVISTITSFVNPLAYVFIIKVQNIDIYICIYKYICMYYMAVSWSILRELADSSTGRLMCQTVRINFQGRRM